MAGDPFGNSVFAELLHSARTSAPSFSCPGRAAASPAAVLFSSVTLSPGTAVPASSKGNLSKLRLLDLPEWRPDCQAHVVPIGAAFHEAKAPWPRTPFLV